MEEQKTKKKKKIIIINLFTPHRTLQQLGAACSAAAGIYLNNIISSEIVFVVVYKSPC